MKKAMLIACAIVLPLVPRAAQAVTDSEYTIDGYDLDITVNEDNTYTVKECIDADFTEESHGIYRTFDLMGLFLARSTYCFA